MFLGNHNAINEKPKTLQTAPDRAIPRTLRRVRGGMRVAQRVLAAVWLYLDASRAPAHATPAQFQPLNQALPCRSAPLRAVRQRHLQRVDQAQYGLVDAQIFINFDRNLYVAVAGLHHQQRLDRQHFG